MSKFMEKLMKNIKNPTKTDFRADFLWFWLFFLAVFIAPAITLLLAKGWAPLPLLLPMGWFAILLIGIAGGIIMFCRCQGYAIGGNIVRFETFGWIVLIAGESAVWFSILSANIKEPQGVWVVIGELYSKFASSPDMFRVLLVGVVVLFISKMYGTHERMVKETKNIGDQLNEMKKELPGIREILSKSEKFMSIGANLIETNLSFPNGIEKGNLTSSITETIKKDKKLSEQMNMFTAKLKDYVANAFSQLSRDDKFYLHTYLAMATKYLEVEEFSYKKPHENFYAYEYRTWFVFYALVVQAIVDALLAHKTEYKFYTILPKIPGQFFNIWDSSTSSKWSTDFLENL